MNNKEEDLIRESLINEYDMPTIEAIEFMTILRDGGMGDLEHYTQPTDKWDFSGMSFTIKGKTW